MKTHILAIASILILTQGVYSQAKSDKEQIADIDKIKKEIKANLNSYTKTERAKSSEGYRYVYTEGKDLRLVAVYFKDTIEDKNVEWYFYNNQLIYSTQVWTNRASKKIIDNEKFYLNNERLFAWIRAGKKIDVNSKDFKKVADEFPKYAAKLKTDALK